MKRSAFHDWMGRIGLAAALLLMLVPTAGRVVHAAAGGAAHAIHDDGGHARHAGPHAKHAGHGGQGGDSRPAIGDPDCDYCPLLASMAGTAGFAFAVAHVPLDLLPAAAPLAPCLRWRHPCGLGSRGPPLHG